MTEKRFSFNWERGHPNFWDNYCDLADCYLTCEDVVELLNEQHEQIERLKRNFKALDEVKCEIADENEQLKKEIEELKWNLELERWCGMTEKRFTMSQNGNFHTVRDTVEKKPLGMFEFKENEFPVYACFHHIIDLLNEFYDENEQLKQQIKDMQIRFKRKYDYEFDEIVDELDLGDVND